MNPHKVNRVEIGSHQIEVSFDHPKIGAKRANKSPLPTGISSTVSTQPLRFRPAAGLDVSQKIGINSQYSQLSSLIVHSEERLPRPIMRSGGHHPTTDHDVEPAKPR